MKLSKCNERSMMIGRAAVGYNCPDDSRSEDQAEHRRSVIIVHSPRYRSMDI